MPVPPFEVEVIGGLFECIIPGLDTTEHLHGIYEGDPETAEICWTWEVWFTDHPAPVFAYT